MANAIKINTSLNLGGQFISCTSIIRQEISRLSEIKAQLDQMITGADYTLIEAMFGLAAGQGVILYNIVAGAKADIAASANIQELQNWFISSI